MTIDLDVYLRRIKPHRRRSQLGTRPDAELQAATDLLDGPYPLLIDTNVYIRLAAGTMPAAAERLVDGGLIFHCSVCLSELSVGVANMDPSGPRWRSTRDYYTGVFARMPEARLLTPDRDVWLAAGLIAGTLSRTQHYQPHQRKECLNDALIYLTAAKAGLPVLTSNRDDFDLIQQLSPAGAFVYY